MRIDVTLPKSWHDLTQVQFLKVTRLFLKNYQEHQLLSQALFILTGWNIIPWRMIQNTKETEFMVKPEKGDSFWISAGMFYTLTTKLKWIIENIQLPAAVPGIRGFALPNVKLYGTTLEQYLMADNFLQAYQSTHKPEYLNLLMASLFLRKGEEFNAEMVTPNARRFRCVSFYRKNAVLFWFLGVKDWLASKYPYVFSGTSSDLSPYDAVINLMAALNGGDITRNKLILQSHLHEALNELNLLSQQSKSGKNVLTV